MKKQITGYILSVTLRGAEHYVKTLTIRQHDNKRLVDYTPNKNEAHAFTTLAVANHAISTIFNPNERTFTAIPHQVPDNYFDAPAGFTLPATAEMEPRGTYTPLNYRKHHGRNGVMIQ